MDIERLMRDLTVEQLKNIQESLSQQTEQKREELRKMVGRRYRDVLEASDTVKRLTELAGEIADGFAETRKVAKSAALVEHKLPVKKETVWRFGLLHKLIPLLNDKTDGLSDVFALLLAENLYRSVSLEVTGFENAGISIGGGLRLMGNFLISHRISLFDRLENQLGSLTEWQEVAGLLTAIAFLKQMSLEELLGIYLTARKKFISESLKSYSTLISVIEMMKQTTECVDDVFGRGRAIISALRFVTENDWCPEQILDVVKDQVSSYWIQLKDELKKVNQSYTKEYEQGLTDVLVEAECTAWIEILCEAVENRIKSMCDYFEKTSEMVEFVDAVNNIFMSEWPAVQSNAAVYQKLFGNSLLNRFKVLITSEINKIQSQLIEEASSTNSNPPPLFQKRGTRFDPLLASGVSKDMHEMIQRIFQKLQELINNTNKYVSIGQEKNVLELNDALADGALNLVKNITADDFIQNESEKERNLMKFRLFLGLVQHEPSTLCLCMNRKTEHIIQCNKLLHSAAEKALSNFMDLIIDETVSESNISKMPNYVANPTKFLDLAQELEKHKLPDSESIIEIPTQLSRFYYNLLYSICQKSNSYSVGHLFTRNVTTRIATILGEILSKSMIETAKSCCSSTPVCTQVQFDAKILFFMFLNKDFMEAVQIVEEKMDPITRTILAEPLTKNAKLFVQRTTLLFGQLQVEPPTSSSSKEIELAPSYTSLIDIVPMITNIPRLPLIPGLSVIEHKTIEEKPKDALKKKKQDGSKVFDQSSLTGLLAKPSSISSFVDKFSSNWFKN